MKSSININSYQHRLNRQLKRVPNYGPLFTCENPNAICGICHNEWNYTHEFLYLNKIKKMLPKNSIGIDIGAHTGTYGIALANLVSSMYSFEPELYGHDALCLNAGRYPNIIPFRLACGDISLHSKDIEVIQLDEFFNYKLKPQFIKIDVDGQEIKILNGAKQLINNSDYFVMLIEFDMKHLLQCNYTEIDFFTALSNVGLNCNDFFEQVIKPNFKQNYFCNILIKKTAQKVTAESFQYYYN